MNATITVRIIFRSILFLAFIFGLTTSNYVLEDFTFNVFAVRRHYLSSGLTKIYTKHEHELIKVKTAYAALCVCFLRKKYKSFLRTFEIKGNGTNMYQMKPYNITHIRLMFVSEFYVDGCVRNQSSSSYYSFQCTIEAYDENKIKIQRITKGITKYIPPCIDKEAYGMVSFMVLLVSCILGTAVLAGIVIFLFQLSEVFLHGHFIFDT